MWQRTVQLYVVACGLLLAQEWPGTTAWQPTDLVDLYIGTGGFGFGVGGNPPGPQVPFGNMRLSPDTAYADDVWLDFQHYGGYHFNDTYIRTFSHTHMVGPGVADLGNLGLMPTRGRMPDSLLHYLYGSRFSHDHEILQPGYYSVLLQDSDINASLTACGSHAGWHHYAPLPNTNNTYSIVLDLAHALSDGAVKDGNVTISANPTLSPAVLNVEGCLLNDGGLSGRNGKGVTLCYTMQITASDSLTVAGLWNTSQRQLQAVGTISGADVGAVFEVTGTADIAIAISYISIDQAKTNFARQAANQSFTSCRATSHQLWADLLGKALMWPAALSFGQVEVHTDATSGEIHDRLTKFYTAIYHSFQAPTQWSEEGGYYLGMDNQLHQLPAGMGAMYTDMSIWDTHRSQIGSHADVMIADAVSKNLTDFDVHTAFEAMYLQATQAQRPHSGWTDLEDYVRQGTTGYLPTPLTYFAAMYLRKQPATWMTRRTDKGYFCQRKNASDEVDCVRDPSFQSWLFNEEDGFCEGDAAEWRWFVPHNLTGLVELYGSNDTFVKELEKFLIDTFRYNSTDLPNPNYWPGNEPGLMTLYVANAAGRPDLTQKYVHLIVDQYYPVAPNGIPGNDDYGALSSWLVFSMLGFYPRAGSAEYFIGSPFFNNVTVHLSRGPLTLEATNWSAAARAVATVSVDGQTLPVEHYFVSHQTLSSGSAAVRFAMAN
ncbi:uncharacterized protein MONBRDRAFT_29317 [Monosiga brevicollis MX1]|uniref:Alpha-1,2-mannosidase n=1 Tax=Monosiga brevicollis TaxID=81824 RepID=A9VAR5_MONBE|nr:uncharacterized protein MONBRDRAFT_29317 [Monosiga brevicollis MX1]EDQ85421.1 predicted protein [Monosiga brevicollis MX1]|eukprot:XP_001749832.1 hypothetical protein [Monosiga brevicollis MX1]